MVGGPHLDLEPLAATVTPLDVGAQAGRRAQDRQGQLGVELEVRVPERIGARLQVGLIRVKHDDMHVVQQLPGVGLPHGDPRREAVGQRRTGRRQGDLELAFADGFEDRFASSERDRLLLDDADALTAAFDEVPPTPGTGYIAHRTLAEALMPEARSS